MAQPSPTPQRIPAGANCEFPYSPLADYGMQNPFAYHAAPQDDFDQEIAESGYTKTLTGNGTIAITPGDGGLALFTTNSSAPAGTDVASLQLPAAGFTLPQGATALKKLFFLTRLQCSDMTNAAIIVGLIQTTGTPFTVTDGVYFSKASGTTAWTFKTASASTIVSTNLTSLVVANNANITLGFQIARNGDIKIYFGDPIIGYLPPQGSGTNTPQPVGPMARILSGYAVSAANLNPTLALQSGTASSKTMTTDFFIAAKER